LLSKLYIYNNVTLVGYFNGLECLNGYSRYVKYNIGFIYIICLLGSLDLIGSPISGLTELRVKLGLGTSRAALRSKYSRDFIKSKCSLKLLFYSFSDKICDHGCVISVNCGVKKCVDDCGCYSSHFGCGQECATGAGCGHGCGLGCGRGSRQDICEVRCVKAGKFSLFLLRSLLDKHFKPSFGSIRVEMAELEPIKILLRFLTLEPVDIHIHVFDSIQGDINYTNYILVKLLLEEYNEYVTGSLSFGAVEPVYSAIYSPNYLQ
jgi:hypothetical protein